MKQRFLNFIIAASMILGTTARADILGDQTGGWSTYMGADTYFYNVQFTSDSVGNQNEYYVEYTPNTDAVPIVVNGASIWGTRTIKQAEQYMQNNGLRPLVGINADYFSFKTGIPMGHTIINGEIVSKEDMGQDGIGFRSDGTGFIKWLDIKTSLSDGENKISIKYINKWLQPGFDPVYLLTDKFGKTTKTNSECIFVICSPNEGRLHVGETMTVTVDDVFIYNGAIEIPEGKMVFVMDTSGIGEYYDFLSRLHAGQILTIANEALGDDGTWSTAEHAISSVGGRLVTNGVANSDFEVGAAPRTAVGIKENGNIIFYTLDGRQKGHSYGAQLKTLAKRMVELGCTEAVNLDGGGSTTISAYFPGTDAPIVVNSPSEGSMRSVSNFIFLKDNRVRTNIPDIVNIKDEGNMNYLSGMTEDIEIESVYDTANYKMEEPYNITYDIDTETSSVMDEYGNVYLSGTGDVYVVLYGEEGYITSKLFNVYETPDEIKLFNQADWKEVTQINTYANEELQIDFSAAAYVNGVELKSNDYLYEWETEGDIGTITPDGIFTLTDEANKEGKIIVTAGERRKEIPVKISQYPRVQNPFYDTETHWARDIIAQMAAKGVIKGLEIDGRAVFRPDNNMTRAEFASMIVNYMGIDASMYSNTEINFADSSDIPLWAQNIAKAVYSEGIMSGRSNPNGTMSFAPNDNITRAEAMTVLGRIIDENDDLPNLPFADSTDIPSWAVDGMKKLYSIGIINGYEDNTIKPNNNIKRAEAAAMLFEADSI